jgi:hypothetical protein
LNPHRAASDTQYGARYGTPPKLSQQHSQTSHKTPQAEPPRTAIRTDALDVADAAANWRIDKAKVIASHGVPPFMLLALPICVLSANVHMAKGLVATNAATE